MIWNQVGRIKRGSPSNNRINLVMQVMIKKDCIFENGKSETVVEKISLGTGRCNADLNLLYNIISNRQ